MNRLFVWSGWTFVGFVLPGRGGHLLFEDLRYGGKQCCCRGTRNKTFIILVPRVRLWE